jgi:mono/diheme cytochrome c family protein
MRTVRGLAVVVLAAVVTACGGGAGPRPAGSGTRQAATGAHVFARDCALCHSLIGNESLHRQGGDLLGYRMSRQELVQFTREMPVRHPLSSSELNAVVAYVFALQQRG